MDLRTQKARYKQSARLEARLTTLTQEALKPAGTEARKAIKRAMTHQYISQVISSNEFSDSQNMRKTAAKSQQGNVRAIGNKTDQKINSYYRAKKGDNLPK